MTDYETIRYESDDRVGVLTLSRPNKHNAQNPQMWQELANLGMRLLDGDSPRCLVVRGDGPSFSSGIDLRQGLAGLIGGLAESPADEQMLSEGLAAAQTFSWIPKLRCPSVAAVHGHAYGAGLQLALSCDFRIFARSAKVGLIETRYGILPDMGATVRLPRIVGDARARELILLGEIIDAQEAHRIGLATRLVADAELATATMDFANRLANQPPLAIQGARRALDAAWHSDPEASLTLAVEGQKACIASEDFREALLALSEGRTPQWQGR
jgi:enoyl-CoA hydratase/carnithine racemase